MLLTAGTAAALTGGMPVLLMGRMPMPLTAARGRATHGQDAYATHGQAALAPRPRLHSPAPVRAPRVDRTGLFDYNRSDSATLRGRPDSEDVSENTCS